MISREAVCTDRSTDTRVERAAVLAAERSLLGHADLITAQRVVDFGFDLLAFCADPFVDALDVLSADPVGDGEVGEYLA